MGEVIDFTEEPEESSPRGGAAAPAQPRQARAVDEAVVSDVVELLRSGKSRNGALLVLRQMGFTLADSEEAVSKAEAALYVKKGDKVNFPMVFLGFIAALVALGAIALVVTSSASAPVDCAEDTFCVQKIVSCSAGNYKSSFRGVDMEYRISGGGEYCQVTARVSASANPAYPAGESMNCLYPIVDGLSDMSDAASKCQGSLASLL